jgi:hypothetical protein
MDTGILEPDVLVTVSIPWYVPLAQVDNTLIGIAVNGSTVPGGTSGSPTGLPIHVILYVVGAPVDEYDIVE